MKQIKFTLDDSNPRGIAIKLESDGELEFVEGCAIISAVMKTLDADEIQAAAIIVHTLRAIQSPTAIEYNDVEIKNVSEFLKQYQEMEDEEDGQ